MLDELTYRRLLKQVNSDKKQLEEKLKAIKNSNQYSVLKNAESLLEPTPTWGGIRRLIGKFPLKNSTEGKKLAARDKYASCSASYIRAEFGKTCTPSIKATSKAMAKEYSSLIGALHQNPHLNVPGNCIIDSWEQSSQTNENSVAQ